VIVISLLIGVQSSYLLNRVSTTQTEVVTASTDTVLTITTYFQVYESSHSIFLVREDIVLQPEVINDICIAEITNTTISSSYYIPSETINGTNLIGIITTSIIYQNSATTTLYENITETNSGSTCTLVNPYYNVTQTESIVGACATC
jgi:hypothetical protein